MKNVEMWADGACSGNPGPGGFCAIVKYKEHEKIIKGFELKNTTNNRMELKAVIEGIKALKESVNLKIYTDSGYIVDSFKKGWVNVWQSNCWTTKSNKKVKNIDLWKELIRLVSYHTYEFIWVKAHDINEYNIKCDEIARSMITKSKNQEN